jgi:hypothetical protein
LIADLKPVGAAWLTGAAQGPEGSVVTIGYFIVGVAVLVTVGYDAKRSKFSSPGAP